MKIGIACATVSAPRPTIATDKQHEIQIRARTTTTLENLAFWMICARICM